MSVSWSNLAFERHHAKSAENINLAENECPVERGSGMHAANGERPYLCGGLPGVFDISIFMSLFRMFFKTFKYIARQSPEQGIHKSRGSLATRLF